MRSALVKIVGWTELVECAIAVVCMTVILVLVAVQVFYRYVLNDPLIWTQEVVTYLFVWFNLLAISVVYKRRSHITMDLFVHWMPEAMRRAFAIVVHVILMLLIGLLTWLAFDLHASYSRFVSPMMQMPKNLVTYPLLFTMASMIVATLHFLLQEIRGERAAGISKMREFGHSGDLANLP